MQQFLLENVDKKEILVSENMHFITKNMVYRISKTPQTNFIKFY